MKIAVLYVKNHYPKSITADGVMKLSVKNVYLNTKKKNGKR
jgi:hypothetical protein